MKLDSKDFRAAPGKKINLRKWPTRVKPFYKSEREYLASLQAGVEELRDLQERLYASGEYALLVIFQAMDAAGKDSAIKSVMSGVNPQGCQVHSFKKPSDEELKHDYLWRTNRRLPERGQIGIFNRSYYEEVLVVKVNPELLRAQHVDPDHIDMAAFWKGRYQSIVDMERHLHRCNTRILKFFLHVSADEQRKRLKSRIQRPEKNWKFDMVDIRNREHWDEYMRAYADCLRETGSDAAPWHVVPADDKKNARLIISRVIVDALKRLKLKYPALSGEKLAELERLRKLLTAVA